MGNFRSRNGCLTCRARRVKCDEGRPVCRACSKKNRPCQWEPPQNKFKIYQPEGSASNSQDADQSRNELESEAMEVDGSEGSPVNRVISPRELDIRRNSRTESRSEALSGGYISSDPHSPGSFNLVTESRRHSGAGASSSRSIHPEQPESPFPEYHATLTRDDAILVHHFTDYLGRWLDCTDATRQFTLGIPLKIRSCPILCHAVLSFAARHRREDQTADTAYQKCITLLIDRLNEESASHDETLLCAIVILRFYEQLNVPTGTGSDNEQHLAGTSAVLRASQGNHYLDPSAPTLREASFWVYVRQCLYNSTINQQPPDIDFSLQLHPKPSSIRDSHPLARLRLETAWANQMTWNLACVVNFCFDGTEPPNERNSRTRVWQELWDEVQQWKDERPRGFNPLWQGLPGQNGPFPEIWFAADWHMISFGFFHFACIMLLTYKPGPKFAIRNANSLSETELQILDHARLICGAAKCAPDMVPLSITVCHTIFIWGPLVTATQEQDEVIRLLANFEEKHIWPTTWIKNALRHQWGLR